MERQITLKMSVLTGFSAVGNGKTFFSKVYFCTMRKTDYQQGAVMAEK